VDRCDIEAFPVAATVALYPCWVRRAKITTKARLSGDFWRSPYVQSLLWANAGDREYSRRLFLIVIRRKPPQRILRAKSSCDDQNLFAGTLLARSLPSRCRGHNRVPLRYFQDSIKDNQMDKTKGWNQEARDQDPGQRTHQGTARGCAQTNCKNAVS